MTAELNHLCVLRPAKLKGIALCQPVIRHFHLESIPYFLLEHAVTITDAASVRRISKRCKGIQEACCQTSQTAVTQSRIRLLILYDINIKSQFFQNFFYTLVCFQVDHIITQSTSH